MSESDLIPAVVERNAGYYSKAFERIQESSALRISFNPAAAVFGPLWAGMRGLSFLFLLLCFLDLLALTQISDGMISGSGGGPSERLVQFQDTIAKRRSEAEAATQAGNAAKAATATKLADNLQKAADAQMAEERALTKGAGGRVWASVLMFVLVRLGSGFAANPLYERRFSAWRLNRNAPHGAHST